MTALAALPLIALASAVPAVLAHRADSRRLWAATEAWFGRHCKPARS